jgi:DNA-binding NtrC family response regulator
MIMMHTTGRTSGSILTTGESQHSRTIGEHPYNLRRAMERFEKGYLHNILELTRGKRTRAAEMLGISLKTLSLKMKKYEL